MRKAISIVSVCLVGLLYLTVSSSAPAEQRWGWFAATSLIDKWEIFEGEANVRISTRIFSAELYLKDAFLLFTIEGTIRDGRIEAMVERHASDDEPRKLKGMYKKTRLVGGGARETILLTQPNEPDGLTVGLTRDLAGR